MTENIICPITVWYAGTRYLRGEPMPRDIAFRIGFQDAVEGARPGVVRRDRRHENRNETA